MKYEIKGGNLPVVVMNLEEGEKVITQGGGMAWMSTNMFGRHAVPEHVYCSGRSWAHRRVVQFPGRSAGI